MQMRMCYILQTLPLCRFFYAFLISVITSTYRFAKSFAIERTDRKEPLLYFSFTYCSAGDYYFILVIHLFIYLSLLAITTEFRPLLIYSTALLI